MKIYSKLIIIGSGPAGLTASMYSSRLNLKPLLITGNQEGGQLSLTDNIENWPGIYEKISGYDLYKKMYNQVKKFNSNIKKDNILKVIFEDKKIILFGEENIYECISLIIATGSNPNKIGIDGEDKYFGKGISTCALCDGPFFKNKNVAIVGGGNTAIEESIYLSKICSKIYLIHRRDIFKADYFNINKLNNIKNNNIHIYKNNNVIKILGKNNLLTNIIIKNKNKNKNKILKIEGLFIAIGYNPNTDIFKHKLFLTKTKHIKINMKKNSFTSTNIPGVFAAGDVIDPIYRQAITASAFGCMSAIDAKNYLNKNNNY